MAVFKKQFHRRNDMGFRNIDFVQPQDGGFFGWLASRHEFNQSPRAVLTVLADAMPPLISERN
jgi:hypothetical protein